MTEPIVYVVHCVDTEGPLYESLAATFMRLYQLFGLKLEPSEACLHRLQNREIELGGIEDEVAKVLDPHLLAYNDTWEKVDAMLERIMASKYRHQVPDSYGGGWVYNWHCLDHVGYEENPRHRDLGFNKVFDRYRMMIDRQPETGDAIHFHHHPVAFSRAAHHSATHFFSPTPEIYEILSRRLIDRNWFPCVNRPGFHAERPDSHWFLEQFIPFDMANNRTEENGKQADVASGRFGDWRRAPKSWRPYHPDHDDYQIEGRCRRWIARSLNVGTRYNLIRQADVDFAFQEAEEGKGVVLSINNHDHREMSRDIDQFRNMLVSATSRFPNVKYRYSEARDAMRRALDLNNQSPVQFETSFENGILSIFANQPTFGPQPYLALKTRDGRYLHDNLAFQEPFRFWTYEFDDMSIPITEVESIGIGSCDPIGNVTTVIINPDSGTQTMKYL